MTTATKSPAEADDRLIDQSQVYSLVGMVCEFRDQLTEIQIGLGKKHHDGDLRVCAAVNRLHEIARDMWLFSQ